MEDRYTSSWELSIPANRNSDAIMQICLEERELVNLHAHVQARCLDETMIEFISACFERCLSHFDPDWFTDTEYEAMSKEALYCEFGAGEKVTWQGAHIHAVFLVEHGRVEVTSNHVHIGSVKHGSIIGSVLDSFYAPPHIRSFTATVSESSSMFAIPMKVFHPCVVKAMQRSRIAQKQQIMEFLMSCKHFDGLTLEQKMQLAQVSLTRVYTAAEECALDEGRRPWGVGSMSHWDGVAIDLIRSVPFVMEGEISVNQRSHLAPGDCLDMLVSLSGRERVNRHLMPWKTTKASRILWINLEELDKKSADGLALQFEHLDRRKPRITDLQLRSNLGEGGFGSVKLVEHKKRGVQYALKLLPKIDNHIPDHVKRECELLDDVRHPFVLQLVTALEWKDSVCIVTELLNGGDLFDLISWVRRTSNENFTQRDAQFYIGSIIIALEALHSRNIVHRDLKPENVMIDSVGYIRLIDLGVSKRLDATGRTFTIIGSVFYMSPEIFSAKRRGYGTSIDFWSLGVVFHELVRGCLPFGLKHQMTEIKEIYKKIHKGAKILLEFPTMYANTSEGKMMQALLQRDPDKRLGSGCGGLRNLKEHEFFESAGGSGFFSRLASWEIEPPFKPPFKEEALADSSSPKTQAPATDDQLVEFTPHDEDASDVAHTVDTAV